LASFLGASSAALTACNRGGGFDGTGVFEATGGFGGIDGFDATGGFDGSDGFDAAGGFDGMGVFDAAGGLDGSDTDDRVEGDSGLWDRTGGAEDCGPPDAAPSPSAPVRVAGNGGGEGSFAPGRTDGGTLSCSRNSAAARASDNARTSSPSFSALSAARLNQRRASADSPRW
jgi:hypothetical protein